LGWEASKEEETGVGRDEDIIVITWCDFRSGGSKKKSYGSNHFICSKKRTPKEHSYLDS
jgi:hypothetical protein